MSCSQAPTLLTPSQTQKLAVEIRDQFKTYLRNVIYLGGENIQSILLNNINKNLDLAFRSNDASELLNSMVMDRLKIMLSKINDSTLLLYTLLSDPSTFRRVMAFLQPIFEKNKNLLKNKTNIDSYIKTCLDHLERIVIQTYKGVKGTSQYGGGRTRKKRKMHYGGMKFSELSSIAGKSIKAAPGAIGAIRKAFKREKNGINGEIDLNHMVSQGQDLMKKSGLPLDLNRMVSQGQDLMKKSGLPLDLNHMVSQGQDLMKKNGSPLDLNRMVSQGQDLMNSVVGPNSNTQRPVSSDDVNSLKQILVNELKLDMPSIKDDILKRVLTGIDKQLILKQDDIIHIVANQIGRQFMQTASIPDKSFKVFMIGLINKDPFFKDAVSYTLLKLKKLEIDQHFSIAVLNKWKSLLQNDLQGIYNKPSTKSSCDN